MSQDKMREADELAEWIFQNYVKPAPLDCLTFGALRDKLRAALAHPAREAGLPRAGETAASGGWTLPVELLTTVRKAQFEKSGYGLDTPLETVEAIMLLTEAALVTPAPKPEPDGWVCVGPDGKPDWYSANMTQFNSILQKIGSRGSWQNHIDAGWTCRPVVVLRGEK